MRVRAELGAWKRLQWKLRSSCERRDQLGECGFLEWSVNLYILYINVANGFCPHVYLYK